MSRQLVLLQGSWRAATAKLSSVIREEFIEILKRKVLTITFWPDVFAHNLISQPEPGLSFDPLLSELSVNRANDFLYRKADKAPQAIDQVSSFELIEHIMARRGKNVSLYYFQPK